MDAGDEEEEMAARIGAHEDVLEVQLLPRKPLAREKDESKSDGGDEPRHGALGDGLADAKPLLHSVTFLEHAATGDLDGH